VLAAAKALTDDRGALAFDHDGAWLPSDDPYRRDATGTADGTAGRWPAFKGRD
jgi:hypothetical protein